MFGVVVIICGLNLCYVKVFGEFEFWLLIIKVGVIVVMIGGGVVILFIGMYFGYLVDMLMFVNLWNYGGFLLNGVGGLIVLLLVVIFVYGGIEVIGMSVGEVKDLECVILCVINVVFVCILLFYVLMMVVLMLISLWIGVGSDGSLFV